MQHSEEFSQVATALAAAQGAFPTIPRDRKVKVTMKSGGSYTFMYAPLETILEKTRPALAANGLALVQAIVLEDDGKGGAVEVLRTTMIHSSGEWFACDVPIFVGTGDNKSQAYSSGVTYSRRYGVTLLLCVAADEDDDGNGGEQDGGDGDRQRPDYERQGGNDRYEGRFPRQGGGHTQPRGQQGGNAPRQPQRRQAGQASAAPQRDAEDARAQQGAGGGDDEPFRDDPLPSFGLKQYETGNDAAQHGADGVVTSPWGDGLTPGQLQMAKSRAEVAGLTDAQVLDQVGPITPANVSAKLAELKRLADKAMAD